MQARSKLRILAIALLSCSLSEAVQAAEPAGLGIASPKPHQVFQRVGFEPGPKSGHAPSGYADVDLRIATVKVQDSATWEYRIVRLTGGTGGDAGWSRLAVHVSGSGATASARIPAGGWYRLEVRCRLGDTITHAGAVEPIGVGEVFMVAGQSYATNCNDEQMKVLDPQKRVVAFDSAKGTWAVANDPQPSIDGEGGSIWPPVGDALVKELQVPVAFANVASGGTSTAQWMPDGSLHRRLIETGRTLGRFRAVLWQQGESDVIAKTTTEKYVANMRAIRQAAATAWGRQPPWLLAKSTLHPTVYNDPAGEGKIRKAVDVLTARPGFQPGPDTDTLTGPHRGDSKSRRHFSALGQRKAAEMWVEVIKKNLAAPRTTEEALGDMYLLEPVWASPIIRRESSVLLQLKPEDPVSARLAFPAAEILEVATADGRHRFDLSQVMLLKDGVRLNFAKPEPVEPIPGRQLFVPKGSPQSYSARVGHPDESLMYHPGRWFHDRNVEITYRRREAKFAAIEVIGTLPKTIARLKAGEAFTVGVSGDSISTGLDASAMTKAAPNQPGYADLVVAQLQARFDSQIKLKNRAVSGWSVANGVADLDKLLAEKPHLVVLAYGMNDVGRRDPKWFGEQTQKILDRIKAADKDIEVILVSSMLGHSEWTATPREMFPKYRDELKRMTGPGVALADVTAVWELLLKNKHDHDLTGNGLNHPNDFGHRLYAQTILSTLTEAAKPFPGKPVMWQGLPRHDFKEGELDATMVVPEKPLPGRPWVWRGEFFGAFAEADAALVKAGWHLAYVKVPDLFGSPKAIKQWEKFHEAMVKEYGLHARPGFIGLSRGGLYCMNWAASHPEKTLGVYLDNAVCDFKSWPGGQAKKLGAGKGSSDEWKKMLAAYDFRSDDEAIAYKLNPVDNLAPLAKAKVPLLLVYGDKDSVVPHTENSEMVFDRYKALGGPVERIVKPGQDHHPHGLEDVAPVVKFFTAALEAKR